MKKAVVLGGGGSRGSYQMGVWKALRDLDYDYSIVAGTSVGALNAAMMVQDTYDLGLDLWSSIKTFDVIDLPGIDNPEKASTLSVLNEFLDKIIREGGVDTTPLEGLVYKYIDEQSIRGSNIDFGLVTVEFPSMRPYVLTKDNIPEGRLVEYLMASAACYPAMKGRIIDGKKYIDGGYHSNLPIEIAISAGAEHIVAVDLECIGRIRPVNLRDSRIKYIRSHWDLGIFLLFDPKTAERNMALGYNDCMKAFGTYHGSLYTFEKLEHLNLADYFDGCLKIASAGSRDGYSFLKEIAQTCHQSTAAQRGNTRSAAEIILQCAENGAKALEVDPTPIYTSESFANAVASRSLMLPENRSEVEESIRSIRNISDAKTVIGSLDINSLLVVACGMLRKAMYDNKSRKLLTAAAKLFPQQMAGALTLLALER